MPRLSPPLAALIVSACASAAPPAPIVEGAVATLASAAPAPAALRLGLTTPQDALRAFGPPLIDRRDGRGALMTWRTAACALTLVFTDGRLAAIAAADPATGAARPHQDCAAR